MKRILIADDDPDMLDLLQMDLALQGYSVAAAADGKEALRLALAESFDLLLLDVMMPHIDGYHVAHEVTDRLGAKAPVIVIMTCRDTRREKGIALMSGAHEVIQKPFGMDALHERLAAALGGEAVKGAARDAVEHADGGPGERPEDAPGD